MVTVGGEEVDTAEWVEAVIAQARSAARSRVFSVSVPVSRPAGAFDASEGLLSEVIEAVEFQGWRLDMLSTYGAGGTTYEFPAFCALLVFRRVHGA